MIYPPPHLKPPRVYLDDPGELAESQDFSVWQVADADLAEERHEVMLAEGEHLNILHQNELVGVFAKDGVLDGVFDCVFIALRQ